MPVIEIKALPQAPDADIGKALATACNSVAAAAGMNPSKIFSTWTTISPGQYVTGEKSADVQPKTSHPPIVKLVAFEGRSPEMVEKMIMGVVDALVTHLKLGAGNVFLSYNEVRAGMIYTGGQIKRN